MRFQQVAPYYPRDLRWTRFPNMAPVFLLFFVRIEDRMSPTIITNLKYKQLQERHGTRRTMKKSIRRKIQTQKSQQKSKEHKKLDIWTAKGEKHKVHQSTQRTLLNEAGAQYSLDDFEKQKKHQTPYVFVNHSSSSSPV